MPLAVPSSSTNFVNASSTIVVTNPASLAAGDLMLANFYVESLSGTKTLPSGFTELDRATTSANTVSISGWKIATAGDVSTGNQTFSNGGSNADMGASLVRVTGVYSTPVSGSTVQANASTTTTINAPTLTPSSGNSVLVFFTVCTNGNGQSVSGYQIATNNPSWTELYDTTNGIVMGISAAYALRPETTATGTATATAAVSTANATVGHLICVNVNPTAQTLTETSTTSDTEQYLINASYQEAFTLSDILTAVKNIWTDITKNTSSWVRGSKNTSSYSNGSKNTSSWTNTNKS